MALRDNTLRIEVRSSPFLPLLPIHCKTLIELCVKQGLRSQQRLEQERAP